MCWSTSFPLYKYTIVAHSKNQQPNSYISQVLTKSMLPASLPAEICSRDKVFTAALELVQADETGGTSVHLLTTAACVCFVGLYHL